MKAVLETADVLLSPAAIVQICLVHVVAPSFAILALSDLSLKYGCGRHESCYRHSMKNMKPNPIP